MVFAQPDEKHSPSRSRPYKRSSDSIVNNTVLHDTSVLEHPILDNGRGALPGCRGTACRTLLVRSRDKNEEGAASRTPTTRAAELTLAGAMRAVLPSLVVASSASCSDWPTAAGEART